MSYIKKAGILYCKVIGYTPYWIDVKNEKTNQLCVIFLKYKMSESFKAMVNHLILKNTPVSFIVWKRDANEYEFKGISKHNRFSVVKRTSKIIAGVALSRTLNEDYNPVNSKGRQKLLVGREGLRNFDRTGNKLSRAVHLGIDDSKAKSAIKANNETVRLAKEKEKTLKILRKRYFYDRYWHIPEEHTDQQWDDFLWENKNCLGRARKHSDVDFEKELKEAGII
jgi:hypothetical protein